MTEWNVRRWSRFGHDRLYASTPGGTDLGYLDLATGRYHSDDLTNLPLLRKAIEDHQGVGPPAAPAMAPSATAPAMPPALPPAAAHAPAERWRDLAEVRAGAAARERAMAERQAQGVVRHVLARVVGAKTEERAWRVGADGEEAVAARLASLGVQWRVLHAVRVGERGADIDHVVIGPGGVFTVNSKHHPRAAVWVGGDTVMVNGRRVPYVLNSRYEAARASRLLAERAGFPVPVIGLVAVVGARRGFTVKAQPADGAVAVVTRWQLSRFLNSQSPRLDLRQIDAIHEVARRSTTWQR